MRTPIKIFLAVCSYANRLSLMAQEVAVDTTAYRNKTVDSTVVVYSPDSLISGDVNVTPTGYLILVAPRGITLDSGFNIQLGGKLNLYGNASFAITYTYDSAGNRIRRERK
ncbi:MAG: hypothetical protein IJ841_06970 [Prevotella sp.]|nr:hypothetical protein [Prevotella sp.]